MKSPIHRSHNLLAVLPLLLLLSAALPRPSWADPSFVRDIAPILLKRCSGCHGDRANQGGFRANTYENLMKLGRSGKPEVVPGKPSQSPLYSLVVSHDAAERMPMSDDPLTAEQASLIQKWIFAGAKFDGGAGSGPSTPLKDLMGPRVHPASPAIYRAPIPVTALAFRPDGAEIAVSGYNELLVWDTATGRLLRRIGHLPQRIQALAYSRDSKRLLVAGGTPGEYGEADLVDLATGSRKVLDTFNDIALSAVFSPDGSQAAAGGADGSVRLYDLATGTRRWIEKVQADWVTSISFSFDDQFIASASKDQTVKIFDAKTGELYTTYTGHSRAIGEHRTQAPVYAVAFSPDSLTAFSAGGGNWIQVWNPIKAKSEAGDGGDMEERFLKTRHTRYITHGFSRDVYALSVRDGQVFAASADGGLKQFDATSLSEVRTFPVDSDWIFALDYDAVHRRIATGTFRGDVHIWDIGSGKSVLAFRVQPGKAAPTASVAQVDRASSR